MRAGGARTFPEGSIIVKEKWTQDLEPNDNVDGVHLNGLGIMVKRAQGFDDEGGNWEYLYMDTSGTITREQKQLEHCRACHMSVPERDAVFFPDLFNDDMPKMP
jgi:hypothetical protein